MTKMSFALIPDEIENPSVCFPIKIDKSDGFWGTRNKTCMDFKRSIPAPTIKCNIGSARQQVSLAAHIWLTLQTHGKDLLYS